MVGHSNENGEGGISRHKDGHIWMLVPASTQLSSGLRYCAASTCSRSGLATITCRSSSGCFSMQLFQRDIVQIPINVLFVKRLQTKANISVYFDWLNVSFESLDEAHIVVNN